MIHLSVGPSMNLYVMYCFATYGCCHPCFSLLGEIGVPQKLVEENMKLTNVS